MMIEMYEVVNYEAVNKILNLLYSQNLHSISPLFHPNSASISLILSINPIRFIVPQEPFFTFRSAMIKRISTINLFPFHESKCHNSLRK